MEDVNKLTLITRSIFKLIIFIPLFLAASCKRDTALKFINLDYDLKTVKAGSTKTATFKFYNPSNNVIKILEVSTECDCLAPARRAFEVKPGETDSVSVKFYASETILGPQERQVILRLDNNPKFKLLKIKSIVIQ